MESRSFFFFAAQMDFEDYEWFSVPWKHVPKSISWGQLVFLLPGRRRGPKVCYLANSMKAQRGERRTETLSHFLQDFGRFFAPQLRFPNLLQDVFYTKKIGCHEKNRLSKFFWGSLERHWWNSTLDDDFFLVLRTIAGFDTPTDHLFTPYPTRGKIQKIIDSKGRFNCDTC